jgi:hypothetical protein
MKQAHFAATALMLVMAAAMALRRSLQQTEAVRSE